jgi:hypothetical protein
MSLMLELGMVALSGALAGQSLSGVKHRAPSLQIKLLLAAAGVSLVVAALILNAPR